MLNKLITRNFRISLIERDKNPRLSFSKLKYSYEYPFICNIADSLPDYKIYNDYIYGRPLPKALGDIGDTNIIVNNSNLENEINWTLLSVRKYKDVINLFLEKKTEYDCALLKGKYDDAEIILDDIEEKISISIWSIENRFLLIELRKGLKENTNFLNEINTNNNKHFIHHFAHFFSIKAEKELSVNRYQVSFLKFFFPLIEKGLQEDFEYYLFKLDPFFKHNYEHLPKILAFENYNSIIDKYLTLSRVFKYSIIAIKKEDSDTKQMLSNRINYLSKKVVDTQLERLNSIIDDTFANYSLTLNDIHCIKCLDLYTIGEYQKAQDIAKEILLKNPLNVELYVIYVKSLLLQNKEFVFFDRESSYLQIILKTLYDLYRKEKNPVDLGIILKKIAYNLSNISEISYFLIDIVKTEIEKDTSFKRIAIINSSFINPLLSSITEKPQDYLRWLLDYFPDSSTINLLLAIEENSFENIKKINIPTDRVRTYKALNLQKNGDYEAAARIWEDELRAENLSNFQIEKILINLFYSKAELGQFDYCIKLYVKYYFINKYLVLRLNVNIVKEQIKKNKYKNVDYSIILPIFFYLIQADDYDIHTAYECFLLSVEVEKPSQLTAKIGECDDNTLFFLKNICTLEIFKHSPFITSTYNKLNERIALCQYLQSVDLNNKKQYIEEENLLSKRLIIQKGLQEIDESKIYVNQASIIQNELKDLKSIFNRYISIKQLSNEKEVAFINLGSEKIFSASLQDDKNSEEIEFSKDPQYDIFKEMFYEVRDKFLYSKYGLKLYLSARIRHGVLLGELRPEFEILHLVTEKEKASDFYKVNKEWKHIEPFCGDNTYSNFNKYLSNFSRQIDQIINDELLDKYLLIRTEEENSEGWLNYEFDEVELQILYSLMFKSITSYDEFVNKIFEELWQRTEHNLKDIQYKIKEDFRNLFFDAIQSLEISLHDLNIDSLITDLYSNLTDVKIKIENKLNKIARWFTITDTQISDSEFTKIIEVCYESLHNHYTSKELILLKNISCDSPIKGQFYTHFVDLFRIFFQNILDYSIEGNVEATLDITKSERIILITVQNHLRDDENIDILREKININNDLRRSQLDKQSGLYKALNIIKTNFENENNELRLDIRDGKFCVEVILYHENLLI